MMKNGIKNMLALLCLASIGEAQPVPGALDGTMSSTQQRALYATQPLVRNPVVPEAPIPPVPTIVVPAGEKWVIGEVEVVGDLAFNEKERIQFDLEDQLMGSSTVQANADVRNMITKFKTDLVAVMEKQGQKPDPKKLAQATRVIRREMNTLLAAPDPRTSAQVKDALTRVATSLVDKGYFLSHISMPATAYDPEVKTLRVSVDAGHIGEVTIVFVDGQTNGVAAVSSNGTWFSQAQIAKKFKNTQAGTMFNYAGLYEDLYGLNSSSDLKADVQLNVRKAKEGEAYPESRYADIDVRVKESFPLHAALSIDNYAIDALRNWEVLGTLQYNNLTKADDVLAFSPQMTLRDQSMLSLAGSYVRPHDLWKGGSHALFAGYSKVDTDNIDPAFRHTLDFEGIGWFGGLQETFNLIETKSYTLALFGNLTVREVRQDYAVYNQSINGYKIGLVPVTVGVTYTDKLPGWLGGRNFASISEVFNVGTFGDDIQHTWTEADKYYTVSRMQLARLQPLSGEQRGNNPGAQWMTFWKVDAQYANDGNLVPVEQIALGGHNTVRGYRNKSYYGENGGYGTLELRTPMLNNYLGDWLGFEKRGDNPFDRLQFVGFVDYGLYNKRDARTDQSSWNSLLGSGLGLRAGLTQYSQLCADFAVPLFHPDENADGERSWEFYLSLQLQY